MKNTVTLKKNYEFSRLYKKGKFASGKLLILYVIPTKREFNRIGITVSKKVGKSVRRNRIRRIIKENYRLFEAYIGTSYDLVFVARSTEQIPVFKEIKKEMKYLLKRLNMYKKDLVELQEK